MSELDRVTRRLDRNAAVAEYVAVERRRRTAMRRRRRSELVRDIDDTALWATVYRDLRSGRGTGQLTVTDASADRAAIDALIDAAVARAGVAVGPAWTSQPPAAPARVAVTDPALGDDPQAAHAVLGELAAEIDRLLADGGEAARTAGGSLRAREVVLSATRGDTALRTNRGFSNRFADTSVSAALAMSAGDAVERFGVTARRVMDLNLAEHISAAARRLRDRPRAEPLAPGRYDVLLTGAALTPSAAGRLGDFAAAPNRAAHDYQQLGWLGPIAAQADAHDARLGLTRYQVGSPIYGVADPTGDPLTVVSDGTRPFGLWSQPFGDRGEPVRRFALVDGGIAAGLALNLREASLRGVPANGGVRNLSLTPGSLPLARLREPGERPLIELTDVAWIEADLRTGDAIAGIELGYADGDGLRPVRGGALRGNLFAMWAHARLAAETTTRGWYEGPVGIRLDNVAID